MNDEMPSSSPEVGPATEAPAAEASAEATSAAKAMQGMANDLKTLGQQFAAVLKAAASTPEAEQLSAQIREGLGSLRDEIDDALSGVRTSTKKVAGDQASNVLSRAQVELANALHLLSRGIDRVASSVGPDEGVAAPAEPVAATNGSGGDTPA